MKEFLKKKENILYLIILITFILLSFFIGLKHEPWTDEAHAWLIARDTTIKDLIFTYLHTDGHPALWHLVLKFFQQIGLNYKYLFVISTLFSSLGIALILFFSKFPKWIKLSIPFTYFIFYQYTIVTRGYCLLLPILALIAIIWDKRHEKVITFSILLLLLLSTEAYTFIFAGLIYIIYIYEFIINKKITNRKKHITCLILLFLAFCFTVYYVYPQKDNTFNPLSFSYYLSSSFFTPFKEDIIGNIINTIGTIAFIILIYKSYKNDKKGLVEFIFYLAPVATFLLIKYCQPWHLGISFILFIFIIWIQKKENNKFIKIIFFLSFLFQLPCSIFSSIYDYNNLYDSSYEMSNFIKKYDYKNLTIKSVGFYASGINAYMESNIYENYNDNLGFFYWNKNAKYFQTTNINSKIDWNYIFDADIVVISQMRNINAAEHPEFNCYEFYSASFIEYKKYEEFPAQICVLKEIDKR